MVQMAGIEPARFIQPQDFKSCASASSATSAYCFVTDKTHYNTSMVGLSIVKWKKYKKVDKKIKKWKNKKE